jgi:hypothetical protein
VILTASDGYRAIFRGRSYHRRSTARWSSMSEAAQHFRPTKVPLALVSLKDTRTGPRHVKWLQSVELRLLDK